MTRKIQLLIIILILCACKQNATTMKTTEHAIDKFEKFIAKEKYTEQAYPSSYSGIADEKMRPILTEKINQVAIDFKIIATFENPIEEKYQEKIRLGLLRFADVYLELDTEDRERVCTYFEELMDIVNLESSNGQLNKFMYGFDPTSSTNDD